MSLNGLFYQTVTITRRTPTPGGAVGYGGMPAMTATTTTCKGRLDAGQGTEGRDGDQAARAKWTLLAEAGADIRHEDLISVDGERFTVAGPAQPVRGAFAVHHQTIPLERIG